MTTVNANMSAEQFFWGKIDRDGSGSIESIFELNEAERRGFSAKIGMTAEEFIKTNKKAIQKKANTDVEYSSYQLEQAQNKNEKEIKEKISKIKETFSQLKGGKPAMGIEKSSEKESDKTETLKAESKETNETKGRGKSLYKVELPTTEQLANVPDSDKEKAKAEYIKVFLNHIKYPEEGGRRAIHPKKLEGYVKQAEEEFEAKWQASRELLEQS